MGGRNRPRMAGNAQGLHRAGVGGPARNNQRCTRCPWVLRGYGLAGGRHDGGRGGPNAAFSLPRDWSRRWTFFPASASVPRTSTPSHRRCTGRCDLEPLLGLEFTGRVRAAPEGRIVLAGEPLLKVDVSRAGGRTPGVVGPVRDVLRDRDHAVNAPAQPLDDGDQALDLDGSTEGDLPLAYLDPHF